MLRFSNDAPRPATTCERTVARALADRPGLDLRGEGACRAAMLEAFGAEPRVRWLSARRKAMSLREADARASGVRGLVGCAAAAIGFAALTFPQVARAAEVAPHREATAGLIAGAALGALAMLGVVLIHVVELRSLRRRWAQEDASEPRSLPYPLRLVLGIVPLGCLLVAAAVGGALERRAGAGFDTLERWMRFGRQVDAR